MATHLQQYIDLGKSVGLAGEPLLAFARQMAEEDRNARLQERTLAKEEKQTELRLIEERKQEQELQVKLAQEQAKLAQDKIEVEMKQQELQARLAQEQAKLLHELELAKIDKENQRIQIEHEQDVQRRRLDLEKTQIEAESRLRAEELRAKVDSLNASRSQSSEVMITQPFNRCGKGFDLGIGQFDNVSENLDPFINRFEVVAKSYELPTKLWAVEFAKTLHGSSLAVYEMLNQESKLDYDSLIQALRKRFGITEGSYRKLFRSSRPLKDERLADFVRRLQHYLRSWLEKSQLTQDYDGLFELNVSQAFFQSLDKPAQTFLKECGKLSLKEMVTKAQNYYDAHPSFERTGNGNFVKKTGQAKSSFKGDDNSAKTSSQTVNNRENKPSENKGGSQSKSVVKCYRCGKLGHKSYDCRSKPQNGVNQVSDTHKAAVCQVEFKPQVHDGSNGHDLSDDHGNELFPVISAAVDKHSEVYLQDLKYPFKGKARVGGHSVNFMRDTGSTLTIVSNEYVREDQFTGNNISVLLADRCVRFLPEAVVHISCPCYKGDMKVLVMENPVYPLIIGNNIFQINHDQGASGSDETEVCFPLKRPVIFENSSLTESSIKSNEVKGESDETQVKTVSTSQDVSLNNVTGASDSNVAFAVQTRSQAKAESRSVRPLKHTVIDAINICPEDFKKLQKDDNTLAKYWKLAETPTDDDSKVKYIIKDDVLFRMYKPNLNEDVIEQLVVPECLRERVVLFAHETTLSGHMGINSTYRKLCTNFYFPGAIDMCKRLVLSCLKCQQGSNRNAGGKAPLQSLPLITIPFHSVYFDLIGKIEPSSADGHTHILTLLDSATHFTVAVPLKKTDSVSIAEELMKLFNLMGYPQIIYSDNGSNLTSDIMKEIYRTFGIQMKSIPVFWPRANLVERQHGIIKSIMRKLIVDQPRQWHRYLDPLMFAIRTTPNASGYSPFELLFGRHARTHLMFLKELWAGQSTDPETKTTYQYVLDLQNRIADTCEFAQKELSSVRDRNHKYYNRNAKLRKFKPQDRVWVLNTKNQRKFDFNWVGPATVIERRGLVVYKIRFDNGSERLYHINMLKPYVSRESARDTDQTLPKAVDESHSVNDDNELTDESGISAAIMGLVLDSETEDDSDESNNGIRLQEEPGHINIANVEQTETWRDVKVNPDLGDNEKKLLWDLVKEYGEIFSDVPTPTNLVTYDIKLKSDEVIRHKPYKIPVHLMDRVQQELDKMLKLGWIERSDSPYASPMVIVKKRDSSDLRICVSYKSLNAITEIDPTPQPDIEDILAKLGKSIYYSTFDASKGFYAIKMEESAKKYTSFVTPRDCYCFNVCPFGLVNAPSIYAKLTRKLLEGAKNIDNFVDDLIAYTDDMQTHVNTLRDLFERVRRANLKLKPSKVKIGFTELTFLGQVVGNGTVRPTEENVEKILNAPIPHTKKGVRSLCGMINWLRKFLPGAAKLLKPLTDLTSNRHSDVINWGPEQQEAWDQVKIILTTQPVLSLFDPSKEHVLACDANDSYVGGALLQREEDGMLHPVMYASRKCCDRETRYDIQNKEMLAIVWCCSRFYRFIYGAPFTIQTDCCALSMLNGKLSNNARVVRWQLYLQSFNFRVEVVRGKDNSLADFMTRMGT
jgi:hypothetical protein